MRNIKLKLKIIITLLFTVILLNSCENDAVKTNEPDLITSVEIKELAYSFSEHFESRETLATAFEKGRINQFQQKSKYEQQDGMTIYVDITSDEVLYSDSDLPDFYTNKQKEFLLAYFNKVANVTDDELLTEIEYYKDLLKNQSFTEEEYNQIYSVLDVGEQTVIAINEMLPKETNTNKSYSSRSSGDWKDFLVCVGGQGKFIARGMVEGAITGLISGALWGAGGGTVVLPGVGTATGAVGGGIFGMAVGAVTGTMGAIFWAAEDCIHHLADNSPVAGGTCTTLGEGNTVCME